MKKYTFITSLIAIMLFVTASGFAQTETPKFDNELITDFSKGMGGDDSSLERAMAKAEKILAANPKDARTLVWMGAATLAKSGKVFMTGDFMAGGKMWAEGRKKMDESVALDGENLEVLIVRGSTYTNASTKYPFKEEADEIFKLGKSDLDKIIASTEGKADEKSKGIRSQAIKRFIKYYSETGEKEKTETYKKMLTAN